MLIKMLKKNPHKRKTTPFFSTGFTLIEIMVAISIFAIVAFITTTTLLVVLDANRRANAWRSIMENVNFAVDSMSYKLKFGTNYEIYPQGSTGGGRPGVIGDEIRFLDRNLSRIAYCRDVVQGTGGQKAAIYRCGNININEACSSGNSKCKPITSPDIDVIEIKIAKSKCAANCPDGNRNEAVVMVIKAKVTIKNETSEIDFQTTVAQSQSH